jgi:hypothetical protein
MSIDEIAAVIDELIANLELDTKAIAELLFPNLSLACSDSLLVPWCVTLNVFP